MRRLCLLFCLALAGCGPASRPAALPMTDIRVCAAPKGADPRLPDASCAPADMLAIDPQNRLLRVEARVTVPQAAIDSGAVYAAYVSAQAAWTVYWNGQAIGGNGVPGPTAAEERPGLVEAGIPIPSARLLPGSNRLTLLISSHHAGVRYVRPFGGMGVFEAPTVPPPLRTYAVALAALGVLGVGLAYFGTLTFSRGLERTSLLLTLACLAAIGQLAAEVVRGFVTYSYPLHVWRVSAIAIFAALFGVLLVAFSAARFPQRHGRSAVAAAALACAVLLWATPGFDNKATACLVVCSGVGAAFAWRGWRAKMAGAAPALAGMAAFPLLALLSARIFLDQTFYAALIGLMLLLFTAQAVALRREERDRHAAKLRAAELELQVLRQQLRRLSVQSRGAREIVDLADVVAIRGADDYAELVLANGSTKLLSETLSSLAGRLPDNFLRIHRSAIVNLKAVTGTARRGGGGLELVLANGSTLAVGRSHVRALKAAMGA